MVIPEQRQCEEKLSFHCHWPSDLLLSEQTPRHGLGITIDESRWWSGPSRSTRWTTTSPTTASCFPIALGTSTSPEHCPLTTVDLRSFHYSNLIPFCSALVLFGFPPPYHPYKPLASGFAFLMVPFFDSTSSASALRVIFILTSQLDWWVVSHEGRAR